jgi:hypothetical protein
MKKGCKVFFAGLIMLLLAAQAQATVTISTANDLFSQTDFLNNAQKMDSLTVNSGLSGIFDFVYLGYEAGDTNALLKTVDGSIVFKNKDDGASNLFATANGLDITKLYLDDLSKEGDASYAITSWSNAVHIYKLKNDILFSGRTLLSGMFIFGFDDSGSGDGDFDDLVFAGSQVPVPGAVWLLGSALVGMVGMRRKFVA